MAIALPILEGGEDPSFSFLLVFMRQSLEVSSIIFLAKIIFVAFNLNLISIGLKQKGLTFSSCCSLLHLLLFTASEVSPVTGSISRDLACPPLLTMSGFDLTLLRTGRERKGALLQSPYP